MTKTAAVLGLGLIGGSVAAGLRRSGYRVQGFDPDAEAARISQDRDLVDETSRSVASAVGEAEIVILATPLSAILDLLPQVEAHAAADALVLDTGSVKRSVVEKMSRMQRPERAIGGHPVAGKETSGPRDADPTLFQRRVFVLSPSSRTSVETVSRAETLARALGSLPVVVPAEEHDRVMARTSHLPQLVSTALALTLHKGDSSLAGPAINDMTRLGRSDSSLWREILLANRDHVLAALAEYQQRIEDLTETVRQGDGPGIERLFACGREAALALQGTSGA